MRSVPVRMGRRSYRIRVVRGSVRGVASALARRLGPRRVAVMSDRNVAPLYADGVLEALSAAGCPAELFVFGVGERAKTVLSATRAWRWLLDRGFDRRSVVLALGGGVVGDLAGFVASTWLRGVDLVQAPTTLLAQVDSSVGGKTGFNLGRTKNMVGTFYQPRLVYASLQTLESLKSRDLRAGLAEVVKHGVIGRPEILELLRGGYMGALEELVSACCEVKRDVVQQDEREAGLRRVLNFGHTFGHAIETCTRHRLRHGEAVGLGMISACRVSERIGWCGPEVRQELSGVLERCGLDTDDGPYFRPELVQLMRADKKVRGETIGFVCVRRIGEVGVANLAITELERMVRA